MLKRRVEKLRTLIQSKLVKDETETNKGGDYSAKAEGTKVLCLTSIQFLENPFGFYQEIFRHNWWAMTNTWYQNHRHLYPLHRKQGVDIPRESASLAGVNKSQPNATSQNRPDIP